MANFQIFREVTMDAGDGSGWKLCFQYGTYIYDDGRPYHNDYRFIWRRPNGQLQGARGQAALSPEGITILPGKAAEEGWYPARPNIPGFPNR